MRLTAEQFIEHPPTSLAKLYAISGAEPLAALEAADALRDLARKAGFVEREVFTVLTGFDWGQLRSAGSAVSLFATQRLLELRIPTGKPGKEGSDALAGNILPELIRTRRGREQRLRIWSAACCSGEEAYSLAIMLHEALPDLRDWHVTITATDINARFLHKAAAGIYGEWSFRNAPAGLKERYFHRTADGRYAIVPQIRKLVNFAHLNLAEDVYPSLATDTNAMDVIFCRNVLMYFTPPQVSKVIRNLRPPLPFPSLR